MKINEALLNEIDAIELSPANRAWREAVRSAGWRIHGEPIADWRAYLRSWHNNGIQDRPARGSPGTAGGKRVAEQSYTQREYTDEQLESLFAEI